MQTYYTLLTREKKGDFWRAHFGDYDNGVVKQELLGLYETTDLLMHNLKIICTDKNQASINAHILKLNTNI